MDILEFKLEFLSQGGGAASQSKDWAKEPKDTSGKKILLSLFHLPSFSKDRKLGISGMLSPGCIFSLHREFSCNWNNKSQWNPPSAPIPKGWKSWVKIQWMIWKLSWMLSAFLRGEGTSNNLINFFPPLVIFNKIYQLFLLRNCPDTNSQPVLLGGQAGNCQQVGYKKNILKLSVLGSFSKTSGFPNENHRDIPMPGISAHTWIPALSSFSLKSLVPTPGLLFLTWLELHSKPTSDPDGSVGNSQRFETGLK